MKHTGSKKKISKSKEKSNSGPLLFCVYTGGVVDLEQFKQYRSLQDKDAENLGLVRIVDDSGESYLYPQDYFTDPTSSSFVDAIREIASRLTPLQ